MKLEEILEVIEVVEKSDDSFAMDAIAELFLIAHIPEHEKIYVGQLIENVVEGFSEVRKVAPTFDFAMWTQTTVIEAIDYMIACGLLDGPSVDMNEESHVLIESEINLTDDMEDYIAELEREVELYAPAPEG
jgi:hypothetical protein